jgi:hypothetical protein
MSERASLNNSTDSISIVSEALLSTPTTKHDNRLIENEKAVSLSRIDSISGTCGGLSPHKSLSPSTVGCPIPYAQVLEEFDNEHVIDLALSNETVAATSKFIYRFREFFMCSDLMFFERIAICYPPSCRKCHHFNSFGPTTS